MAEDNNSPVVFQIPGNIKEQFLPFVINPKNAIHKSVGNSTKVQGSPSKFTYKLGQKSFDGVLQFYPSSFKSIHVDDDISFKLLYQRNSSQDTSRSTTSKSIGIADILNAIPGVQIREFLPDTRLDQCINLFLDMMKGMTKLFTKDDDKKNASTQGSSKPPTVDKEAGILQKIMAVSWFTIKYMTGMSKQNLYTDMLIDAKLPFSSYNASVPKEGFGFYVMTFPYTMYYRMQSCVTTNIFEVPGILSNKELFNSQGSAGWGSGSDLMSAGGFRLSNMLSKLPLIGNLANMILGNIGINYLPWWNAEDGAKVTEPQVDIKFDLFNDTSDAALVNFIFVHTLIGGNKWIQYNMFQHSSNIYDVKIEGVNRLYACRGDFEVSYDGVLRDPPVKWLWLLAYKHGNVNIDKEQMFKNLVNNKIIKIPDVYHVTMKFQSLLPANFNNYIYNYAENNNHIVDYAETTYQGSILAKALPNAISGYTDKVKQVWDASNSKLFD